MVLTIRAPAAGEGRARAELGSPALNCVPSREILRRGSSDPLQRPVDLVAGDRNCRRDPASVAVRALVKHASALPGLVLTSSRISITSCAVQISSTFAKYADGGMMTPASPWIGSTRKATVFGVTASSSALASPKGMIRKPGANGPK